MKKEWIIKTCVLFTTVLLMGCSGLDLGGKSIKKENEIMEYNLNQEEIHLLQKVYVDEERISKGNLLSYQKLTLEQFRFGKKYLERKYPSYKFEIIDCNPMTRSKDYADFCFKETAASSDDYYILNIYGENENQFEGADDFYGEILSEEYERYIKEKLIDYKDDIKGLNVCFTQMQGEEIDESITIDKIFEKKMDVPLLSKIFIKVENQTREEMEELSAAVERIINQADIYGAYILYFVKEDDIISRGIEQNVLKHDDYVYKYSFQNFNQGGDENAGPE